MKKRKIKNKKDNHQELQINEKPKKSDQIKALTNTDKKNNKLNIKKNYIKNKQ